MTSWGVSLRPPPQRRPRPAEHKGSGAERSGQRRRLSHPLTNFPRRGGSSDGAIAGRRPNLRAGRRVFPARPLPRAHFAHECTAPGAGSRNRRSRNAAGRTARPGGRSASRGPSPRAGRAGASKPSLGRLPPPGAQRRAATARARRTAASRCHRRAVRSQTSEHSPTTRLGKKFQRCNLRGWASSFSAYPSSVLQNG